MANAKQRILKEVIERAKAGDGLAMDYASRMARAKQQGFDTSRTMYHGSDTDIVGFDPSKFGSATGSHSAEQGVWLTDSPDTARSYAEYKAKSVPVAQKLKEADIAEAKGDWDAYDKRIAEAEQLEADIYDEPRRGQSIMPVMSSGRFKEFDAKGADFMDIQDEINGFIGAAKSEGYEGATFKNLSDDAGFSGRPSTHQVVFDPSSIRSVNAAFDPAKKASASLLASAVPAAVGLGALYTPQQNQAMANTANRLGVNISPDYGSITPDEAPYADYAADFIDKHVRLPIPLMERPLEGLSNYLRNMGTERSGTDKYLDALGATLDILP